MTMILSLQAIALYVACLCHDLDHRGKNNDWMKNESTPLAAVYTTSTLEHHHFNQTITILQVITFATILKCIKFTEPFASRNPLYAEWKARQKGFRPKGTFR